MKDTVKCTSDLAGITGKQSGESIMMHGYSTYPLLIFHGIQLDAACLDINPLPLKHIPIEIRSPFVFIAEGLNFLELPTQGHNAHNVDFFPPGIYCGYNNAH